MSSDAEILDLIGDAFSGCPRPEHFTNYTHCEECEEHDKLLRSRNPDNFSRQDAGHGGWDPICFISPAGFAYYFPALARLALEQGPEGANYDWYGNQLLFHLSSDLSAPQLVAHFSVKQREAVLAFLMHLGDTREDELTLYGCSLDDWNSAVTLWSGKSNQANESS
jgi:hypothetical protein